jgi:hypothetical protein
MKNNLKEDLRTSFDFDKIYDFCEKNIVTIHQHYDSQYHCYINRKEWDTPKGIANNPFGALLLGVINCIENKNNNK